jgi:hypothetical protein
MPEELIWKLFIQAVQGIAALHQLQVRRAGGRACADCRALRWHGRPAKAARQRAYWRGNR